MHETEMTLVNLEDLVCLSFDNKMWKS